MHLIDDTLFAYATGRINAIENRLLTSAKFDMLDKSTSKDDILKILSDAGYDTQGVNSIKSFEKMLKREKDRLYALINELSNDTGITDIFLLKNDYHNLKVFIKQEFLKNPLIDDELLFIANGSIHLDRLALLYVNRDFTSFSDIMKNAVLTAISHMQTHRNPQEVDIILDNAMYMEMKVRAGKLKNEYVSTLISTMADLVNIRTFLRVKAQKRDKDFLQRALVPGGNLEKSSFIKCFDSSDEAFVEMIKRTKYHRIFNDKETSLYQTEKACDMFLMNYASSSRFSSVGIEPIVAYMIKKEHEIGKVKTVIVGKESQIWKSA